ncbi:glycosyltransferase [Hyunsoonleella sp. SJ7]|uniref:Glycosyltransferase n=1 Tax=Hyunsoonleella aquatilis TaxID=2762758 RepID=A0A923KLC4_9FLAO|nr:glycosyltransferase [Hyunsoonleella aquatilis]MBC3757775.1 glycosyltransferase [Hyunsoonleella aquatilis]
MQFLVITDAPTLLEEGRQTAYAPYVVEMDIWFKNTDEATIVSPSKYGSNLLTAPFKKQPRVVSIPAIHFSSFLSSVLGVLRLPIVAFTLFRAMRRAEHIHLRCPGTIGLLGCFVQILFPGKTKTVKYAGNWDPNSKQPLSYQLQKKILSNTFLSRNIKVLVYGEWENQSGNIQPFFTASFNENEKEGWSERNYDGKLEFVFAGSLVSGKRPLLAIKIIQLLRNKGVEARLDLYGDGPLKNEIHNYILDSNLQDVVAMHGNQPIAILKEKLKRAHFSILPSKSEGWPKALAEGMFFGSIPIGTTVSCVPYMFGFGEWGILIEPDATSASDEIIGHLSNSDKLKQMAKLASQWSQQFTLETFEQEIKKLLKRH